MVLQETLFTATKIPMIDLTPEQAQALRNEEIPKQVRDPETNTTYVLVPSEMFDRVKVLLEEDDDRFVRDLYPPTMEVFGREGWDDPAMDVYNELDPGRQAPTGENHDPT